MLDVTDGWGQMSQIYLGHDWKKDVIISVRTWSMVMIYTSTECENDCFEEQIMKNQKRNILRVGDQWDKTVIILDHLWEKKL